MARVKIQVAELEYDEGSNTIWIHSPRGMTVLRIVASGQVNTRLTKGISSHCDINVQGDVDMFVAEADKQPENTEPCHDSPADPNATPTSLPSSNA